MEGVLEPIHDLPAAIDREAFFGRPQKRSATPTNNEPATRPPIGLCTASEPVVAKEVIAIDALVYAAP